MSQLMPVEDPKVGELYHVSWAAKGCVWRCISIEGDKATLRTLKTKREIEVTLSELRHTRKKQARIINSAK